MPSSFQWLSGIFGVLWSVALFFCLLHCLFVDVFLFMGYMVYELVTSLLAGTTRLTRATFSSQFEGDSTSWWENMGQQAVHRVAAGRPRGKEEGSQYSMKGMP